MTKMANFIAFRCEFFRNFMVLTVSLFIFACTEEPECTGSSQCLQGQICQQQVCVDRNFGGARGELCDGSLCRFDARPKIDAQAPNLVADAGSGSMFTDASITDVGNSMPRDGGSGATRDADLIDAAPLPIIDGGPGFDGGSQAAQALADEGQVWMSELEGANERFSLAGGRLDDNTNALFSVTRSTYVVNGGECEVVSRRTSSGAVLGVAAHRIIIDYTDFPHQGGPLELSSPGSDGRFTTMMPLPTPPIFGLGRPVVFSIQSNSNLGELQAGMYSVDVPPSPAITFPIQPNDGFSVSNNPQISWNVQPSTSNLDFVAELADTDRATVLTCRVQDTVGRIQIPEAALRAWSLAGPSAPVELQLRYDSSLTQSLPRHGGQVLNTVFRVSRGMSYPLLP